jgi:hypothetical protein
MNRQSIVLILAALGLGIVVFAWLPLRHAASSSVPRPASVAGSDGMPGSAGESGRRGGSSAGSADVPAAGVAIDATPSRSPGGSVEDQGHLPLEAHLLTGGLLNQGSFDLLESTAFDAFYDRFDRQNFGVTDELTGAYRDQLETGLRASGQGRFLRRLSCATDVCIATIREGRGETWFDGWYDALQSTSALPIMALTQAAVPLPGGDIDHRLMFTTRPGSGGFALGLESRVFGSRSR